MRSAIAERADEAGFRRVENMGPGSRAGTRPHARDVIPEAGGEDAEGGVGQSPMPVQSTERA